MMLFTACAACYLGLVRLRGEDQPELAWLVALYAICAGPMLASLVLLPIWRRSSIRFPRYAGDWVLLGSGFRIVVRFISEAPQHIPNEMTTFAVTAEIFTRLVGGLAWLIIGIVAIGLAIRRGNRSPAWRLIFLLLVLQEVHSLVFLARIVWYAGYLLWYATYPVVLLGLMGTALVCDLRRPQPLPWTHWMGALVAMTAALLRIVWWYVYVLPNLH